MYWLRVPCDGVLEKPVRRDVQIVKSAPTTVTGPLGSTVHVLRADAETDAALAAIDWNRRFRRVCLDPARGLITLMSPSRLREDLVTMFGDIVDVAAEILSGAGRGIGSTRLRGSGDPPDTGLEPDCAFYVGKRTRAYSAALREGEAAADTFLEQTHPDLVASDLRKSTKKDAEQELAGMVAPDQYIGDLITLDYGHADILVHDTQRNRANGIPHGCLLLATRITPADLSEKKLPKDPSLLLIRVSESARLRSDADLEIARLEAVKRANDTDRTYDESGHTDQFTLNMLRYSGIRCRILGTFRACESGSDDAWVIHYGSDISNFNAGQGMKIYKPSGPSLERIVNRRRIEKDSSSERKVGRLRYSAAIMEADAPEALPVSIQASDFIAQRTALFGMTRTGKSNTTKTIAKALFELRSEDRGVRVGQWPWVTLRECCPGTTRKPGWC